PATGATIARRLPVILLKSVDFPTLGRPTSTTDGRLRGMTSGKGRARTGVYQLSLSLDSVSLTIYSIYKPPGDPKHDQGRHRQRSLENRGYHQGQSRGGRGCGLRRDAHLDAAWRTNRAPRLRRLSSEAAQARHRSQPENGQRSSDPSGPDDPVQAGQ